MSLYFIAMNNYFFFTFFFFSELAIGIFRTEILGNLIRVNCYSLYEFLLLEPFSMG